METAPSAREEDDEADEKYEEEREQKPREDVRTAATVHEVVVVPHAFTVGHLPQSRIRVSGGLQFPTCVCLHPSVGRGTAVPGAEAPDANNDRHETARRKQARPRGTW